MSRALPLSVSILAVGILFSACSSPRAQDETLAAPSAYQPEGADMSGLAPGTPEPIDLSGRIGFVRTLVEPSVLDTRDLPVQRQITGPFDGQVRMIKHQLPEHRRDKSLPRDGRGQVSIGQAAELDRVDQLGGTGFTGISQTEWSPPDPTIAVGPNHIVQTVNAAIAFFDKNTGQEIFSAHLGTPGSPGFFEPVGADSNFVFDPKCFYDHKAERFVVMALETSGASWIDIAVSDDNDPNGLWYRYRTFSVIDLGGTTYWVDYPGFGFDDDAWYVTGNLFKLSGPGDGFGGQLFRVFDKQPMLDGQPVVITDFAPNSGGSLQVAQMFGDAPRCYFLSRVSTAGLALWTIDDPVNNPTLQSVVVNTGAPATGPSQDAPNPGGGRISTLDGRLMNVHYRDGNLYTAHGIDGPPGLTVARWYHIDVNGWPDSGQSPAIAQVGEVTGDNGRHYFFPAIYSDRDDSVAMVTASSGPTEFASVRVSGRVVSDPEGTMSQPIELAIGDNGADGRWGDYLDIAIDPEDDKTFWLVGMYQKNFGWQTWIDRFTIATPCPADLDGNGELSFFDISLFLGSFNAGGDSADVNGDGVLNFFDISAYIQLYNAGCP